MLRHAHFEDWANRVNSLKSQTQWKRMTEADIQLAAKPRIHSVVRKSDRGPSRSANRFARCRDAFCAKALLWLSAEWSVV